MKARTCGDWEGKDIFDCIGEYGGEQYDTLRGEDAKKWATEQLEGVDWIFAYYCYQDYSGEAYVVFGKEGKVFENGGGHCSCYGIEGQWAPQQTSIEAVKLQLTEGTLGRTRDYYGDGEKYNNTFKDELVEFIQENAS